VALALLVLMVGGVIGLRVFRDAQAIRLTESKREAGMAAYRAGDYDAALHDLSYAVSRRRDDVELLLAFADTRSKLPTANDAHLSEAAAIYDNVLRLEPLQPVALRRLLDLYLHPSVARPADAAGVARRILEIDAEDVNAVATVARYEFSQRNFGTLMPAIATLQRLEPQRMEWRRFELATLLAQSMPAGEIIARCDRWIEENPEADGSFHYLRASALAMLGRLDEAALAANLAADRGAQSPELLRQLIQLLDELGETDRVDALFAQAKTDFPQDAWVWEEAVRRPWLLRDLDAAETELDLAEQAMGASHPDLLRWRVLILTLRGRSDKAEPILAALEEHAAGLGIIERDARRAWIGALRAHAQLSSSRWADAQRAFKAAIALDPRNAMLHYLQGEAYRGIDELELAAASYDRAAACDPMWLVPAVAYTETLLELGRPVAALDSCVRLQYGRQSIPPAASVMFLRAWLGAAQASGGPDAPTLSTGVSLGQITAALAAELAAQGVDAGAALHALYFDALAVAGDRGTLERYVTGYLDSREVPMDVLLVAARAASLADLPYVENLVDRAERLGADPIDLAEVRAAHALRTGTIDEGLAAIERARLTAGDSQEASLRVDRLRAWYLSAMGHPAAADALRALLDRYTDNASVAAFVLAQDVAWLEPDIVRAAIDRRRAHIGGSDAGDGSGDVSGGESTRLMLAEAMFILQFESTNDQQRARALTMVSDVLRQTPDSLAGLLLMADALASGPQADRRAALEQMERALQLYPSRFDLYPKIISLYQEVGDFRAAAAFLDRLERHAGNSASEAHLEARLRERQGDIEGALARLASHVGAQSPVTERLALASLMIRNGRHDDARAMLDELLQVEPVDDRAVSLAADLLVIRGRISDAMKLYERHPSVGGPAADATRLADFHERHGRLDEALALRRRVIELDADNPEGHEALAATLLLTGDAAAARKAAEDGLRRHPDHPGLRVNLALASIEAPAEKRARALKLVRELGPIHADLVAVLETLDRINMAAPRPVDLGAASALARTHGGFLPAYQLAVNVHAAAGQIDRAIDLCREAIGRHPNEWKPADWAVQLLLTQSRFEEALDLARIWRRRSLDDSYQVDFVIAAILLHLDRAHEAAAAVAPHLDRAAAERTINEARVRVVINALVAGDRYDEAEAFWRGFVDEDPAWVRLWLDLADDVDPTPGRRMLAVAEEYLVNDSAGMLLAATAWARQHRATGDMLDAERADALAVAAARDPAAAADAALLRGSIAEGMGELDAAVTHYRSALRERPDTAVALNNLAFLLSSREADLEEADALSARAVGLEPDIAAFHDTRAVVLLRMSRAADAEVSARQAVAIEPARPSYHLTLATAFASRDRFADAIASLDRAEALLRDAANADKTLAERIQSLRRQLDEAIALSSAGRQSAN